MERPRPRRIIKVMLLDGQSAGPYHNWRLTTPVLKEGARRDGTVLGDGGDGAASDGDFSSFKPEFDQYKAVVMNLDSPDWPADLRASLEKYVSGGGGAGDRACRRQCVSRVGPLITK